MRENNLYKDYYLRLDDLDMHSGDNERAVLHLTSPTEEKRLTLAVGESTTFDGKTIEVLETAIGYTWSAQWVRLRITEAGIPTEVIINLGECY